MQYPMMSEQIHIGFDSPMRNRFVVSRSLYYRGERAQLLECVKDIKTKDEMCKFTQKVKAFAYDHKKTIDNDSKNDDVFRFSEPKKTVSDDDTDVFARLNKKYN